MKPALQLRMSQQLKLTPQLRQAIRLLQLSQLELEAELSMALESNPMLESAEERREAESLERERTEEDDPHETAAAADAGEPDVEAIAEPSPQEKQTVKLLLEHLRNNYSYWQEEAPNA